MEARQAADPIALMARTVDPLARRSYEPHARHLIFQSSDFPAGVARRSRARSWVVEEVRPSRYRPAGRRSYCSADSLAALRAGSWVCRP